MALIQTSVLSYSSFCSPLVLCSRVGSSIQFIDPQTLQTAELPAGIYWRTSFESLCEVSDLVEFLVLDIEPSRLSQGKYLLADAQVVISSTPGKAGKGRSDGRMDVDEGISSQIYHCRTHLGRHLQAGDTVKGYFLRRANINNPHFEAMDPSRLPDVVLVKKSYPVRRRRNRHRNWRLKSIAKEAEDGPEAFGRGALGRRGGLDQERVEKDYENFLRDLEEDPELRATVNLYKSDVRMAPASKKTAKSAARVEVEMEVEDPVPGNGSLADTEDTDGDEEEVDFPEIKGDELLDAMDDLTLDDKDAN